MKANLTRFALRNRIAWNEKIDRKCSCAYCRDQINVEDELTELERLAEIGRATEKAFEFNVLDCIASVEELLDWAKED